MNLPPELLFEIFLFFDLPTIGRGGQVSRLFHFILDSDPFWREQLIRRYGSIPSITGLSLKEIYRIGGTLWSASLTLEKATEIQTPFGLNLVWKEDRFFWEDRPVREFVTAYYQAGLIDYENQVWLWGQNVYGQLGFGDSETRTRPTLLSGLRAKQISIGPYYSLLLDFEGRAWIAGGGSNQFDLIPNKRVRMIAVGEAHAVLLDDEGRIWVRGANGSGQLGLGHTRDQDDFVQLPNLSAKAIAAGAHHTLFIDMNDLPWGCGYNIFGQLGTGDYNEQHVPIQLTTFKVDQIGSGGYSTALIDFNHQVWFAGNYNPNYQNPTFRNFDSFWASRLILGGGRHFVLGFLSS